VLIVEVIGLLLEKDKLSKIFSIGFNIEDDSDFTD
jgi:hypothetical protein